MRRSAGTPASLNHRVLDLDRAAHGVDDAAEFNQRPIPGALDDSALMHRDCWVNEIAAQRAQTS